MLTHQTEQAVRQGGLFVFAAFEMSAFWINNSMTEFDRLYESAMSRLAAGAMIGATLLGGNISAQADTPAPQGTNSVLNVAQNVANMAVPKDRPDSFENFKTNYMFAIYHRQAVDASLSNPNEGFAGERYTAFLKAIINNYETKGKYTVGKNSGNYVVHNGTNYVQILTVERNGDNYDFSDVLATMGRI